MGLQYIQLSLYFVFASLFQYCYAEEYNVTTPVNAVYVQHRETKLFVGKDGKLVDNVKNAQGFFISLADASGNIAFVTQDGGKVLKVNKCRVGEPFDLRLKVERIDGNKQLTGEEYFLTVNNDYSIGSRCGNQLLVVPDKNKKALVAQTFDQCRNKNSTAFKFINVKTLKIDDPEPGVDTNTVPTL